AENPGDSALLRKRWHQYRSFSYPRWRSMEHCASSCAIDKVSTDPPIVKQPIEIPSIYHPRIAYLDPSEPLIMKVSRAISWHYTGHPENFTSSRLASHYYK